MTRLATQKTIYFLEAGLDLGLFGGFQAMPLGPYDSRARYKDAEPIAVKKNWIVPEGTVLSTGDSITEASPYAGRYLRSETLASKLVDRLASLSDVELETWATVHAVANRIPHQQLEMVVEDIRRELAADIAWAGKLRKSNFSDTKIHQTLKHLKCLGLVR